jgi:hypothetical protein
LHPLVSLIRADFFADTGGSPPRAIAERVGEVSIAVTPWPHQQRAFQRFWQQWQRELRQKFGLDWPIYSGKSLDY